MDDLLFSNNTSSLRQSRPTREIRTGRDQREFLRELFQNVVRRSTEGTISIRGSQRNLENENNSVRVLYDILRQNFGNQNNEEIQMIVEKYINE